MLRRWESDTRKHSLWRRANAWNVNFSISVRRSIYIINSIDKPNFYAKTLSASRLKTMDLGSDTWPSVVRLNINSIWKFYWMRRWLNRDVLVAFYPVGWGFDNRDYDDRVREPPKSFFFFFPKPSRRCRSRPPKSKNFRMLRSITLVFFFLSHLNSIFVE